MQFHEVKTRYEAVRFLQEVSLTEKGEYVFAFKGERLVVAIDAQADHAFLSTQEKRACEGADILHSHPEMRLGSMMPTCLSTSDIEACVAWRARSVTAISGNFITVFFNRGQFKGAWEAFAKIPWRSFEPKSTLYNLRHGILAQEHEVPGLYHLIIERG